MFYLEKPLNEGPLPYEEIVDFAVRRDQLFSSAKKKVYGLSPYIYSYLSITQPGKIEELKRSRVKNQVSYIFFKYLFFVYFILLAI